MGYRRTPLALHEWYHCYNRGVDKRITCGTESDYRRFEQLLYLSNDHQSKSRASLPDEISNEKIFMMLREAPLVSIAAYTLMPNHFHLVMQEIVEGGITRFMHKIGTAYTMYFNTKNERTGNLFVKPFHSKHVADGRYLKYLVQYIHLNAAELFEPQWKEGNVKNIHNLEKSLRIYHHSSLPDYLGSDRVTRNIVSHDAFNLLHDDLPPLKNIVAEAAEYYSELK